MFWKKPPTTNHPATLLVGLGNPGREYSGNRHNVGFMAIDRIATDYRFKAPKKTFGGELAEGMIGDAKIFLLKPLTYMNLSGECLGKAARFYKIPLDKIIVIHDELDLPLGKLRVKKGGGNGGHNGLKSIDAHMGKDYWRMRFGIEHPGDKERVTGHVLSDFSRTEHKIIEPILSEISHHIALLLQGDEAGFMNRLCLTSNESRNTNHESRD